MAYHARLLLGSVFGLAITIPIFGFAQEPESEHRLKEKVKKAFASPVAPSKTMPPNAILVLDPGVDPKGDPKVFLHETEDKSGLTVDIPETVHVHKYFPCGSREFQAQYFAGGPTIVSALHPYTHEIVYVHLNLSPGFPKVKYEEDKIEYKYPEENFSIHFTKCGDVTTSYCGCPIVKGRAKTAARHVKDKTLDCTEQLKVNKLVTTVGKDVQDASAGTTQMAGTFVSQSTDLFLTAIDLVPGVKMLKSAGMDRATKERDRAVQKVARERADLEEDINTIR